MRCAHVAAYACLHDGALYVRRSHLCVASYPKPLAKLRIIEDICKKIGKKLRKFYVTDESGIKKGRPLSP